MGDTVKDSVVRRIRSAVIIPQKSRKVLRNTLKGTERDEERSAAKLLQQAFQSRDF